MFFERMQADDVAEVLAIEIDVYPYPWSRGNFLDSLCSGYEAWVVRDATGVMCGYFLLMLAVDDAHLLNIAVRRDRHSQGVGRLLMDRAVALARGKDMTAVLLEVRPSNGRALAVYQRYGFVPVGRRKAYYPAVDNLREDAVVMRLSL
jgi:ribosomal-protein-alanine N-acetyltransferase